MSNVTSQLVIGNELTVNALEHLCGENYRKAAKLALSQDSEVVLIPAEPTQDMFDLLEDVNQLNTLMTSSNEGNEPVYTTVEDFLKGRNNDSSLHKGYIVVNVLSRRAIALKNRDSENFTSNKLDIILIACKALSEFRVPSEADFDLIDPDSIMQTFSYIFEKGGNMSQANKQALCNKVNAFGGAQMEPGDFMTFNRGSSTGFYLTQGNTTKEVQLSGQCSKRVFEFVGKNKND